MSYITSSKVKESLDLYLDQVRETRLLNFEEEVALSKRIWSGRKAERILSQNICSPKRDKLLAQIHSGVDATHTLVISNLRLVVAFAKGYVRKVSRLTLLDFIQEGNAGLLIAAQKFDWRRGFRFGTYATWWIRQCIDRALKDKLRVIRIPAHFLILSKKYGKAYKTLFQKLGRKPSIEEIAHEMGIKKEKVSLIVMHLSQTTSYQSLILSHPDGHPHEIIEQKRERSPDDLCNDSLLKAVLREAFEKLDGREKLILSYLYGLHDGIPYTLEDVSKILGGLSRERINQLKHRALRKLSNDKRIERLFNNL